MRPPSKTELLSDGALDSSGTPSSLVWLNTWTPAMPPTSTSPRDGAAPSATSDTIAVATTTASCLGLRIDASRSGQGPNAAITVGVEPGDPGTLPQHVT